jgi:hypothetical protein
MAERSMTQGPFYVTSKKQHPVDQVKYMHIFTKNMMQMKSFIVSLVKLHELSLADLLSLTYHYNVLV